MFWPEDDLNELAGTAVVGPSSISPNIPGALRVLLDKIGKEDAERDYKEKVVPVIEVGSRPRYQDLARTIIRRVGPTYSLKGPVSFIVR